MAAKYTYRKNSSYESAYEVVQLYRTIGEVEHYDDRKWVAELNDGRRGYGRTRAEAVDNAQAVEA